MFNEAVKVVANSESKSNFINHFLQNSVRHKAMLIKSDYLFKEIESSRYIKMVSNNKNQINYELIVNNQWVNNNLSINLFLPKIGNSSQQPVQDSLLSYNCNSLITLTTTNETGSYSESFLQLLSKRNCSNLLSCECQTKPDKIQNAGNCYSLLSCDQLQSTRKRPIFESNLYNMLFVVNDVHFCKKARITEIIDDDRSNLNKQDKLLTNYDFNQTLIEQCRSLATKMKSKRTFEWKVKSCFKFNLHSKVAVNSIKCPFTNLIRDFAVHMILKSNISKRKDILKSINAVKIFDNDMLKFDFMLCNKANDTLEEKNSYKIYQLLKNHQLLFRLTRSEKHVSIQDLFLTSNVDPQILLKLTKSSKVNSEWYYFKYLMNKPSPNEYNNYCESVKALHSFLKALQTKNLSSNYQKMAKSCKQTNSGFRFLLSSDENNSLKSSEKNIEMLIPEDMNVDKVSITNSNIEIIRFWSHNNSTSDINSACDESNYNTMYRCSKPKNSFDNIKNLNYFTLSEEKKCFSSEKSISQDLSQNVLTSQRKSKFHQPVFSKFNDKQKALRKCRSAFRNKKTIEHLNKLVTIKTNQESAINNNKEDSSNASHHCLSNESLISFEGLHLEANVKQLSKTNFGPADQGRRYSKNTKSTKNEIPVEEFRTPRSVFSKSSDDETVSDMNDLTSTRKNDKAEFFESHWSTKRASFGHLIADTILDVEKQSFKNSNDECFMFQENDFNEFDQVWNDCNNDVHQNNSIQDIWNNLEECEVQIISNLVNLEDLMVSTTTEQKSSTVDNTENEYLNTSNLFLTSQMSTPVDELHAENDFFNKLPTTSNCRTSSRTNTIKVSRLKPYMNSNTDEIERPSKRSYKTRRSVFGNFIDESEPKKSRTRLKRNDSKIIKEVKKFMSVTSGQKSLVMDDTEDHFINSSQLFLTSNFACCESGKLTTNSESLNITRESQHQKISPPLEVITERRYRTRRSSSVHSYNECTDDQSSMKRHKAKFTKKKSKV